MEKEKIKVLIEKAGRIFVKKRNTIAVAKSVTSGNVLAVFHSSTNSDN